MRRRKRSAPGREAVAPDTVAAYQAVQRDYETALIKLWSVPPEELVEQTAVVLGKLLDYQQAFRKMVAQDALFMQQTLVESRGREEAEAMFQLLCQKVVLVAKVEEEYRADRVVFVALALEGRKSSSVESREWTQ